MHRLWTPTRKICPKQNFISPHELLHGGQIAVVRAQSGIEIEALEILHDLFWTERAPHMWGEHGYAGGKERGAATQVGQNDLDRGILPFASCDD